MLEIFGQNNEKKRGLADRGAALHSLDLNNVPFPPLRCPPLIHGLYASCAAFPLSGQGGGCAPSLTSKLSLYSQQPTTTSQMRKMPYWRSRRTKNSAVTWCSYLWRWRRVGLGGGEKDQRHAVAPGNCQRQPSPVLSTRALIVRY